MGVNIGTGFYVGVVALLVIAVIILTGHCGGDVGFNIGVK